LCALAQLGVQPCAAWAPAGTVRSAGCVGVTAQSCRRCLLAALGLLWVGYTVCPAELLACRACTTSADAWRFCERAEHRHAGFWTGTCASVCRRIGDVAHVLKKQTSFWCSFHRSVPAVNWCRPLRPVLDSKCTIGGLPTHTADSRQAPAAPRQPRTAFMLAQAAAVLRVRLTSAHAPGPCAAMQPLGAGSPA